MTIKTPVLTKIALGSAIACSIVACKPKADDKTTSAAATTTSAASETSKETIVYINQDTLLAKYQYAIDMAKTLQDKGKSAQAQVQSKGMAIQHEFEDYQKNANTMPADQRQTTEQHLQREQEDFQNYKQNAAAGFQNEQIADNNKVYDKIADFAKTYAKEKGYKMVLMYSKSNPTVLYGDQSLDVTSDVIKGLNDAYSKDKK